MLSVNPQSNQVLIRQIQTLDTGQRTGKTGIITPQQTRSLDNHNSVTKEDVVSVEGAVVEVVVVAAAAPDIHAFDVV